MKEKRASEDEEFLRLHSPISNKRNRGFKIKYVLNFESLLLECASRRTSQASHLKLYGEKLPVADPNT
jgi:hypothetical protein